MKEYTAIYSSETLKNIQYSFKAEGTKAAIDFCKFKFSCFPNIIIIENMPNGKANEGHVVWANGYDVLD